MFEITTPCRLRRLSADHRAPLIGDPLQGVEELLDKGKGWYLGKRSLTLQTCLYFEA